jgi:amino acid adenylation domain-containing protein
MLRRFRTLLAGALSDPETAIAALPVLDPPERHQLLLDWVGATPPYPRERCVHELVAEQARRRPQAVALLWGEDEVASLTYGELEARANRLAHRLQRLGVTTETVVGVCLERSPELVVTLLAVLKAGGAYLPLDPAYPAERLAAMAVESAAPVVVTIERLLPVLPPGAWRTLCLDSEEAALAAESATPPRSRVLPESLAYVLYTSGSTGRPKGVAVTHRGIVRLVTPDTYHFSEEEVVLQSTPLPFDVSTFEIWGALTSGGRLALAAPGTPLLSQLAAALGRFGVTTFHPTAGMFYAMVEAELPALARVRQLVAGGDVLSAPHAKRVLSVLRCDGTLVNVYGPTESTVSTSCHVMRPGDELGDSVPIGRPIAHSRVVLLDARLEPVAIGVPGEIYVGGDCLARGYLGRPDLTAERFLPDPLPPADGGEPGGRLYRTGDLARWLPDGRLDFLGRVDRQVKIRGIRIEPAEIEATLATYPAVAMAVVLARSDPARGKELVAYVVPRAAGEEGPPSPAVLREHLRGHLPEYMVPAFFVALPALPLDPNGKVDRRALARIEPAPAAGESAGATPRTPLEEALAGLMGEVLGRPRLGIHDDFFTSGGHSLLAVRLVSRLRESLGVELPLRRLFEHPTVAELAGALDAAGRTTQQSAAPPLVRLPEGAERPLSFAQERLWILDRFEPGNSAYSMPAVLRLRGTLDAWALQRSLDALVARHETLRTTFPGRAGRAAQVVAEHASCPLPLVDLAGLSAAVREREAERLLAQEARRPFDLAHGPLLRALRVRSSAESHSLLLLNMHHIVSDGWSLEVFVREMAALYTAARERRPQAADAAALAALAGLLALPIRYADFAAWQRRWLAGAERDRQLAYWRRQLAGAPRALELPTDRPRPPVRSHRGGYAGRRLPGPVADRLLALSRRQGASLFMVLLAAFALLLHRLAGEEEVVVGTPIAGRGRTELEGLIGIFLNTLVLRISLAEDPPVRELLVRVRETALDAYAHQDVPFEMLLDELKPERDLSRTPLFQVFFNMLSPPAEMRLPGLTLEPLPPPETPSKFDLTLYVQPLDAGIRFDLVYNRDLFDQPRMEELLDQLCGLLHRFAGDAEARLSSLSLHTAAAAAVLPDPRAPMGSEWQGAVHQRVTWQARRAPERLALRDGAGAWTYAELEARSNRLAHALLGAGLRPEEPVAIYAHRCATLVWAVLGTLKAGGAFVILDPAYPPARQIEVLRLAAPRAFLHLTEAGPLPAELAEFVAARPGCVRLDLAPATFGERAGGGAESEPPAVAVGPDHLAVIAFTSGSTGRPKGILGRHGPLSHFLPWQCERFGLGPDDRFSMLSGLAHDPLQRDIFTPLWLGAALAIPDPADFATPGRLAEWMRREGVTVSHLTPAMAQILTERPAGAPVLELPAQRYVFLVGDVLTRRDVARLRRLAPAATCVNLYGSTETQRAVGYHVVEASGDGSPAAERGREILPLGRGMRDVQLLVLNPAGGLAGIGEVGEICVRSPHLARGYLGDEAATGARFPCNPFTGQADDRIYRTGDLGRYLPDGDIVFVARADQQVKIRGFRVELGEIEAQLGRLPAVREAVVLARGDSAERRLVAYVTPDPAAAQPPTAPLVRSFLQQRLPAYMVPAGCVLLDRLPVTPNGKVDRKALLAIDDRHRETDVDYRAPQTDAELTVATVLQEVLKVERVGSDDNFFEIGGNSLLLVQVHSRLQELFGREILLVEIFNHPTVRALAAHLAGDGAAPAPRPGGDRSAQLRLGRERLRQRFRQRQAPDRPRDEKTTRRLR